MMSDLDGDKFRDKNSDWPSVVGKRTALKRSSFDAVEPARPFSVCCA